MSETKTYVIPDQNGCANMMGILTPLLQQRGIDPGILAMMNNNGFGGQGGWFIWILFIFLIFGWGNNGFGGQNGNGQLANMLNNDTGRELLMSAIQGNGTAISLLSATLNCDINAVQGAINSLSTQLCNVGSSVNLSGQQVINAIQQGNMTIAQQLASCCCDIRESVTKMGYETQLSNERQTNMLNNSINTLSTGVERGFSATNYATRDQTCQLQNTIRDASNASTTQIISKLDQMQTQALQDKIQSLRDKAAEQAVIINNGQLSAMFGQMIGQAVAPINAAITGLTKEVSDIQCKLPHTVTVPDPQGVFLNSCTAAQLGLYGGGWYNNGIWG